MRSRGTLYYRILIDSNHARADHVLPVLRHLIRMNDRTIETTRDEGSASRRYSDYRDTLHVKVIVISFRRDVSPASSNPYGVLC